MQYGNNYVNENYSKIVEPNLYGDAVMQPGKTFNAEHQGDANAGLVKIYKQTRDEGGDPEKPAGDFSHENTSNTLIDLRLNNAFRKSKKIHKVTANSVSYQMAESVLSTATQDVQEDWQQSALACLVNEGTILADTSAITAANLKTSILALRRALRKKHARPDCAIASVDLYSTMLEVAGKDYTPSTNENTLTSGRVGQWLGMTWYEGDLLDKVAAKYYSHDDSDTPKTVDLSIVDLIMYDHRAFHCVDNLEVIRLVDATDFVGTYAQVEINSGFRVSNPDMVAIRKKAAPDCTLSALTLGSLTLTPVFDADTTSYTTTTTNASNVITATAADSAATVAIDVDGTPVASGSTATWNSGVNVVTVTVTNDAHSKVYTVAVTK